MGYNEGVVGLEPPPRTRPRAAPLGFGDRVGRFRVNGVLGSGGMGQVVEAEDPDLDRRVALKVLHPDLGLEAERAQELLAEARAAARLAHPNVVPVYEAGLHRGRPFVVMECVRGPNLAQWANQGGRSWKEALALLIGAGRGLEAAHAAGLVHRDIKPQNILVDGERARITDFGIARSAEELARTESVRRVDSGARPGTPAYMAPEQRRGEAMDPRTDQYAFAVTASRILDRTTRPPRRVRRALERARAERRADRFPSMGALLEALEPRSSAPGLLLTAIGLGLAAALTVAASVLRPACPRPALDLGALAIIDARLAPLGGQPAAAWARARALFEDYGRRWSAQWADSCRATRVERTQSVEAYEQRRACLERHRHQVEGLVASMGAVEDPARALERALSLSDALPWLSDCADVEGLLVDAPLPASAEARARLERLQEGIALAHATAQLGETEGALGRLRALLGEARAIGYGPATAETHLRLGQALHGAGAYREALAHHRTAASLATDAGADRLAARAWVESIRALLGLGRFDEALVVMDTAQDLLAKGGIDPSSHLELGALRGEALREAGRYVEAKAFLTTLLEAAYVEPRSPDPVGRARVQTRLGAVLEHLGEYEAAEAALEEARRLHEARWPEGHPRVALVLFRLGVLHQVQERFQEALELYERALRMQQQLLPAEHPDIAYSLHRVGGLAARLGDAERGREALDRALQLTEARLGPDHPRLIGPLNERGLMEWAERRFEVARRYHERALRIAERRHGVDHPAVGTTLQFLGGSYLEEGRFEDALEAMDRAVTLGRVDGRPDTARLAYPLFGRGWARAELAAAGPRRARAEGLRQAGEDLRRALDALSPNADPVERAHAEAVVALIEHLRGDRADARRRLRAALAQDVGGPRWRLLNETVARWRRAYGLRR